MCLGGVGGGLEWGGVRGGPGHSRYSGFVFEMFEDKFLGGGWRVGGDMYGTAVCC